jgi:hypothetical protein
MAARLRESEAALAQARAEALDATHAFAMSERRRQRRRHERVPTA